MRSPSSDGFVASSERLDVELELLLDLLQVLLGGRVGAENVIGRQPVFPLVLALSVDIARTVALPCAVGRLQAVPGAQVDNTAFGALNLLDEPTEFGDDSIDGLLVEAHLLERLDHLLSIRVDLGFEALFARWGAMRARSGESSATLSRC